jgi:hypothetical protein
MDVILLEQVTNPNRTGKVEIIIHIGKYPRENTSFHVGIG